MKRFNSMSVRQVLLLSIAPLVLSACIQAPITPYEGGRGIRQGSGGARESVDGVDVWIHGEPPRAYEIIGYTTVESQDDWVGNRILLSRVAARVREARGDAAVFMNERSRLGVIQNYHDIVIPENRRVIQIAIVRYR